MPYPRRRYGRRRRFTRRRKTGASSWATLAKKAYRTAMFLRSVVNVEKKHLLTNINAAMSNTGAITHLSAIAQGDTVSNRNGNSVKLQSLYCPFTIKANASSTQAFARVLIYMDLQQVADSAAGVTDVLYEATVESPLNINTAGRFKVLYDKVFNLDDAKTTSIYSKPYIPIKSHVRYNGTASSDVQKGGIYILYLSNESTYTPNLYMNAKLSYVDN